jgi:hypothetical protein
MVDLLRLDCVFYQEKSFDISEPAAVSTHARGKAFSPEAADEAWREAGQTQ